MHKARLLGSVRHTSLTKPEPKRGHIDPRQDSQGIGQQPCATTAAQWMGPLPSYTRLHALHRQMNAHAHRAHVGVSEEGVDVGTRRCEVVVVIVRWGRVASRGLVLGRELCMSPRKHAFPGTAGVKPRQKTSAASGA